jgi:hypothetical protein
LNPRPLGYEPYDVCLCRLGSSLVTALTSIDPRREVFPDLLRLLRLGLSRRVRFTNRFTELTTDLRFPKPFSPFPLCRAAIRGRRHGVHARQTTAIGPLRPELAAPLGVCPSSQLARCAGGCVCWRLSEGVAVLLCCTVYRISSSAHRCSDRFKQDQRPWSVRRARHSTALNCNPNFNHARSRARLPRTWPTSMRSAGHPD